MLWQVWALIGDDARKLKYHKNSKVLEQDKKFLNKQSFVLPVFPFSRTLMISKLKLHLKALKYEQVIKMKKCLAIFIFGCANNMSYSYT